MTQPSDPIRAATLAVGENGQARPIATLYRPAERAETGPMLVWLGGYRSDMTGTKALEMDRLAGERGLAALRFDYSGHGQSGGAFRDGTISRWLEETLAVINAHPANEIILVGSSMGGWIALRAVQELGRRPGAPTVRGMVLIAPAPDFTSELIEPALSDAERRSLEERGFFEEPSQYSPEPNIFTRALIEDGRRNRVLQGLIETRCPVHILQGMRDEDVPYQHALKLMEFLPADDVVLTLVRDGDHRLSRPQDIERMQAAITALL
ncbi:alpha/beta hydrolase [Rhizobium straminoryzae]|uniref:Palmitoyl-protein thioesterase ABHD10, mitochondrial n=1 Tax=Rhizobium straminoryzae TaxID=1387186 RepID=A0A549SZP5_9HYPH|nr:alpha/beta hydrolase [Rhizobium straminoryzae]TRL35028.1 alpha/beta hydrolase [Rhizobium straminoryzae]